MNSKTKKVRNLVNIPNNCKENYLSLNSPAFEPLVNHGVLLAGVSKVFPPYEIGRVKAKFHGISYTRQGQGEYITSDGKSGYINPGDILINPVGTGLQSWALKEWHFVWFHLADIELWEGLKEAGSIVKKFRPGRELAKLMEVCLAETPMISETSLPVCKNVAKSIGLMLEREFAEKLKPEHDKKRQELDEIWQVIRDRMDEKWDAEKISELANMSRASFFRATKEYYACTPLHILMHIRMEAAKIMLQNSDISIDIIAQRVGYETRFSFSSAFKQFADLPPAQYRKNFKR